MNCMKCFLFMCVLSVVCGTKSLKTYKKRHPHCAVPNELEWNVTDFKSIVSWKISQKCGLRFENFTVEMCLSNCNKSNGVWGQKTCEPRPFQDCETNSKNCFKCKAKINASLSPSIRVCSNNSKRKKKKKKKRKKCSNLDYRETTIFSRSEFSAPNLIVVGKESTSITVSIQEPSGEFLKYFDTLNFFIYIANITDHADKDICKAKAPYGHVKDHPVKSTMKILSEDPSKNQCPGNYDTCRWKAKDLKPETVYCVFGTYRPSGPDKWKQDSELGYTIAKTVKQPGVITGNSSLLVGFLTSGSVVFILISSVVFIAIRRWIKPIKTIEEQFQIEMAKDYKYFESLTNSIFSSQPEIPQRFDRDDIFQLKRRKDFTNENQDHVNVKCQSSSQSGYLPRDGSDMFGHPDLDSSSFTTTDSESSVASYIQKQSHSSRVSASAFNASHPLIPQSTAEISSKHEERALSPEKSISLSQDVPSCSNASPETPLLESSHNDSETNTVYWKKEIDTLVSYAVVKCQCSRQLSQDRRSSGIEEDIELPEHEVCQNLSGYQHRSQFCGEENALKKLISRSSFNKNNLETSENVEPFTNLPQPNGYMQK